MKRIVVTTVFAAVAAASGAAQSAPAATSHTVPLHTEPLPAPSYQIVVRAQMVGTFAEVSGLGAER